MRIVIQRVAHARVEVDSRLTGAIERGVMLLVGFGGGDSSRILPKVADRVVGLRIFPDDGGHTNLALDDVGGGILAIPQFTLYADIRKGRRPSFTGALEPKAASALFDEFVAELRTRHNGPVETGVFGANMQVTLLNDGPVTILLDSSDLSIP